MAAMPGILKSRLVWLVVVVAVLGTYAMWPKQAPTARSGAPMVQVQVPELTGLQQQGKQAFDENCAGCHGANAAGQTGVAPPLIHRIYEPSHHGDAAIARAAKMGAPQHHWPFGDMPPVTGITDAEITVIVAYLRAVQRANDIY
jgi:mono/diheme cytochrome c family protein